MIDNLIRLEPHHLYFLIRIKVLVICYIFHASFKAVTLG